QLADTEGLWAGEMSPALRYPIAVARLMSCLYIGDTRRASAAAHECMVLADRLPVAQIPWLDSELHFLCGRVALLCDDRGTVAEAARRIARLRWPAVQGYSDLLNAALASRDSTTERAEQLLNDALLRFDETGTTHFVMIAKFRLGQILGPRRGHTLISEAITWCQGQGVADAERMFNYLAPWA
ncbi:MAG: hypothetical protein AAGC55_33245, partial [Myxococcota bacterium]